MSELAFTVRNLFGEEFSRTTALLVEVYDVQHAEKALMHVPSK